MVVGAPTGQPVADQESQVGLTAAAEFHFETCLTRIVRHVRDLRDQSVERLKSGTHSLTLTYTDLVSR